MWLLIFGFHIRKEKPSFSANQLLIETSFYTPGEFTIVVVCKYLCYILIFLLIFVALLQGCALDTRGWAAGEELVNFFFCVCVCVCVCVCMYLLSRKSALNTAVHVYMCVCVCVYVCLRERERERESEWVSEWVREREREGRGREGEREREREREESCSYYKFFSCTNQPALSSFATIRCHCCGWLYDVFSLYVQLLYLCCVDFVEAATTYN